MHRSNVPGGDALHSLVTRSGQEFRILVEESGLRRVYIDDPNDRDRLLVEIVLEPDEADEVADLLHSTPIVDRVASLERRLEEHLEQRARDARAGEAPPGLLP